MIDTGCKRINAHSLISAVFTTCVWTGLMIVAQPTLAAIDKITSSTEIALKTPSRAIPESALLDVGIPRLNDGLE